MRDATAGEQPIEIGYCHNDYSIGEVAEKLVADESNRRGDMIAREQANRKVRLIGSFPQLTVAGADVVLQGGVPIRTGMKFAIGIGSNIQIWARQRAGVANLTTGAIVQCTGTCFGRWM